MRHPKLLIVASLFALAGMASAGAEALDVTITWNDLRQRITGFGANTAYGAGRWIMNIAEPNRTTVLNQLFDTTTGAGLSIIRGKIPGDAGDYQVMQEAKKRGVTQFWSAPWGPPSQWTGKDVANNTILQPQYYQNFADYLSTFVKNYKSQYDVDLMAISVQNEPHAGQQAWECCYYSGANVRDFIKNNLGPTFAKDGIKAKILLPESNWDATSWATPTISDSVARKYAGVVAYHFYFPWMSSPVPIPHAYAKYYNLELWETECSNMGPDIPGMAGAMDWVKIIHGLMTLAEANAYHYWWLYETGSTGEGLIYPSGTTKRLWTLANWSRFVRPGWRMIGLPYNYSTDSLVGISAFRDMTSGKFAIVAVNLDQKNSRTLSTPKWYRPVFPSIRAAFPMPTTWAAATASSVRSWPIRRPIRVP